jgi:23S rRNA (guanosine2251-2'-O)-methyltransferase
MTNELVCGIRPVMEALNSDVHVEKLLIRRDMGGEAINGIKTLALAREVPWQPVPPEKLDRLTKAAHQGVIAYISAVALQDLDEVIQQAYDRGEDPFIVALDEVTDVRNMGAIARSAECFGAHGLLVPKHHSARLGSDAIKSSAGALLRKPVCRVMDLKEGIDRARAHGLRIVACTEKTDQLLDALDLTGPMLLVMGAEDTGISPAILGQADLRGSIPMAGAIGSLNVSVAAGIAMHAVLKQRLTAK